MDGPRGLNWTVQSLILFDRALSYFWIVQFFHSGPLYRRSKADLRRWQGDSEYEVGGGDTSRKQYSKQKNKSTRYRKETDENEEQNESRLASLLGMIRNHRLHGLVRNSFEIALVFERVAVLTNQ